MMITTQHTQRQSANDLLALYTETMHHSHVSTSNLIGLMRGTSIAMQSIAMVVAITLTMLILAPTAQAAREELNAPDPIAKVASETSDEAEFSKKLQQLEKKLEKLQGKLDQGLDGSVELADVRQLDNTLRQLDTLVTQHFDELRSWIEAQVLSAEILQRHDDTVSTYRAELTTLLSHLEAVDTATDEEDRKNKVGQALGHLKSKQNRRSQQPFDPNDLPNRALEPESDNPPKQTEQDFVQAGLFSTPYIKLAAHGDFHVDQLAGASDPAFLAETVEVSLSAAIQAKATELNHDPVAIYHWVLNNVEWLPTWGSVQDADLTLSSGRGNAFDIASLLIALLRASDIPARYVHGTVEVPASQFQNWAGDFATIEAALTYASTGGIPSTGLISGGQITNVRLEHIWVEAAIDFQPSRGAINRSADSWVALDPSFKQYDYLDGLDLLTISGIDADAVAQNFLNSGTVNDAENWATGFDPTILENAQTQTTQTLEQYIDDNFTDPTVGDVIGGRKAIIQQYPVLPSGLPYRLLVSGARYAEVPNALRHQMTLGFGRDILGDILNPTTFPLAQLNNSKITLSFRPATQADEDALAALLPEGEITDVSQLPSRIPSYLISVIPELSVDGTVIKQGGGMQLGSELSLMYQSRAPTRIDLPYEYKVIVGSYLNIPIIAQSVSQEKLTSLQSTLEQTKAILETQDQTQLASLTREHILGDLFYTGGLGYFAQYTALGHLIASQTQANHSLFLGYGSFGYEPYVDYFFGFPRAIEAGGIGVNIRVFRQFGTQQIDTEQSRLLNIQTGILSSALEHAVPEQLFNDPNAAPADGVSAVKALALANSQGQQIYQITPANQAQILPNIHFASETMDEIRSALAVDREVITHTDPIAVPGWAGAGYIIMDPVTGSAAYKISGGNNGGFFTGFAQGIAIGALFISLFAIIAGASAAYLVFLQFILVGILFAQFYAESVYTDDSELTCISAGRILGILIMEIFGILLGTEIVKDLLGLFMVSFIGGILNDDFDDLRDCLGSN